jgi:hypothetical protein
MARWIPMLLAFVLAGMTLGCGDNVEKGANKDKDRPKPEATK